MLAWSFLIESSSKLLVTRTGIKARSSSILGRIRRLILELLALEWRKFHTFELEYLWSQLANLDQILCVASLGWGKGCIRFWGRLTLAHWTQVGDRCPLGYLFSNNITSEAVKPILSIFHIQHLRQGEQIIVFLFQSDKNWLLWQPTVSIDLQWEKWKLAFIAISLQRFWQKSYRNVPWAVPYQIYESCSYWWIWLVSMATKRLNLQRNIQKSSPEKP